ncbi:MAG TPA: LLM class flavin-dependent oxidoreductase [Ktedonobacteraceae bacterium]|nr:LLM class flavin-dependent oxidoreductase [Ktedonobacteraceae bacterium]
MEDSEQNAPLFGLNIDPSARRRQLAFDLARLADDSNLDLICVQDHPYNPDFFDTWTLLTALGMVTEEVHLLPNVLNLPLRAPAMLAKAAATLDLLTDSRLELGLGAGAFTEGVVSYGGPKRTPGEAVSALEEALHILHMLWQSLPPNSTVSFEGDHYQLHNVQPGPPPAHDIPIWLGGNKPRMLRVTGLLADGLLISSTYIPPEEVPAIQQAVDVGAKQATRSLNAIRRGYNLMGAILSEDGHGIAAGRKGLLIGTPRQWIEEILHYYNDLRLDTFIFWPVMGDEQKQAQIFAEEVVPAIKENLEEEQPME